MKEENSKPKKSKGTKKKGSKKRSRTTLAVLPTPDSNHGRAKGSEYEMYCLWKSLPVFFRLPPPDRITHIAPSSEEFLKRIGIVDENIYALSEIKSQGMFAEIYKVGPDTLSEWNKTEGVILASQNMQSWAQQLSKNVIFAMYNKIMRTGDAAETKLWFQIIEQWSEKQQIEHKLGPVVSINYEVVSPVTDEEIQSSIIPENQNVTSAA